MGREGQRRRADWGSGAEATRPVPLWLVLPWQQEALPLAKGTDLSHVPFGGSLGVTPAPSYQPPQATLLIYPVSSLSKRAETTCSVKQSEAQGCSISWNPGLAALRAHMGAGGSPRPGSLSENLPWGDTAARISLSHDEYEYQNLWHLAGRRTAGPWSAGRLLWTRTQMFRVLLPLLAGYKAVRGRPFSQSHGCW